MELVLDVYKRPFDPRYPVITCEPLAGTRTVKVTERKTKLDWAYFVEEIADRNESAEK
jgi:hypothetical protein